MIRKDFRSYIIPTTIGNTDEKKEMGNSEFDTTDLIYLDSYDEQYDGKKKDKERRISATDYAQMNNAYIFGRYTTRTGRQTTWAWLRSAYARYSVDYVNGDGVWDSETTEYRDAGLCPSLHYHLPDESEELEQFDIREVKDPYRKNYISYITYWRVYWNKGQRRFE